MSGPKRNPDKLNTIGVVVVGVCGAVMVYVTIVALEAFYVSDTSELQTMADYGGQDTTAKSHKADEMRNITEAASNGVAPGTPQTYRIRIDHAMELVVGEANGTAEKPGTPDHLVPLMPPATSPTVKPIFSRGQPLETPAPPPAATPPTPIDGAGSGAAMGSGAGSAAAGAPVVPDKSPVPLPKKTDDKKTDKKPDDKKAEPKKAPPATGSGGHAP